MKPSRAGGVDLSAATQMYSTASDEEDDEASSDILQPTQVQVCYCYHTI